MRGYEWGTGTVKCSFCGVMGHNITTCSNIDSFAAIALKNIENNPDYRCTWHEAKALKELRSREERKQKRKSPRKKPTCSFCGSPNHRRNKCKKHAKFMKDVCKANANWRRAFVSQMNVAGYGIGSLVVVPVAMYDSWTSTGFTTGIVVGYNKEKLNLFCTIRTSGEYYSEPSIEILCDGKVCTSTLSRLVGALDEEIVGHRYTWNHYQVTSLSPSISEPPDSFYEDSDDGALNWFSKKISIKDRQWSAINQIVQRWK